MGSVKQEDHTASASGSSLFLSSETCLIVVLEPPSGQVAMLSTGESDACACNLPLLTSASVYLWLLAAALCCHLAWEYRCECLKGSIGWLSFSSLFRYVRAEQCASCDDYVSSTISLTTSLFLITAILLLKHFRNAGGVRDRRGAFGSTNGSEMSDRGPTGILIPQDG